jgi:sn1-specific diacylglycerol lipase
VQVPYVVAVDHAKKKVLLVVRGTLSLNDCFTDALIHPTELKEAGEMWGFQGEGHYAHRGFLAVALSIRQDLERSGVLHKLLGETDKISQQQRRSGLTDGVTLEGVIEVDKSKLPDVQAYQLVLVGHSMGAAVASLVGLLLRPVFPRLICVTYSMPATVMSYQLAEECSEWLRTVWVGKDVVARSSYRELIALRERIYDVLVRCKVNKTTVLRSLFTHSPADRLLYAPEDAPRTPEAQEMESTSARL